MSTFDDALAQTAAEAGVTVEEVNGWKLADWDRHIQRLERRAAAMTADLDRGQAAARDASRCGCSVSVQVDEHDRPVVGTAKVNHVCGGGR